MRAAIRAILLILSFYYIWGAISILLLGDTSPEATAATDYSLRSAAGLVLLPALLMLYAAWKPAQSFLLVLFICISFLIDALGILIYAVEIQTVTASQIFTAGFKLSSPILLLMHYLADTPQKAKP